MEGMVLCSRRSYWRTSSLIFRGEGILLLLLLSTCHHVQCQPNQTTTTTTQCDPRRGVADLSATRVLGEHCDDDDGACHQPLADDGHDVPLTVVSSSSSPTETSQKCTIYLAPSTIPGAGLGIFTSVPRKQGDTIGNGDVFLPLLDLEWHNRPEWRQTADQSAFFNPFSDYVWTGETMGMENEVGNPDHVEAMCPGLDAAINCNLALINVGKALPVWDDGGLHRSRDPGAGALTPYHNGSTPILHRDIPAGGELFKSYGDAWFETRPESFETIPLTEDYSRAQNVLDAFGRLTGLDEPELPARLDRNVHRDLWNLVITLPLPPRTRNALPRTLEDAQRAIDDDVQSLHQPHATRDVEYLEQHGKCFDHIRPGRSTIPQAGRGAFAVRPLSAGTIISGSPVLHLPHENFFHIYDSTVDATTGQRSRSKVVVGKQVMLNYCFGHAESTLILCPYGAGVSYINHNQTLANVRVQWSKNGVTGQNDSWFDLTPPQMEWLYRPHLALDYVALRDIQEGEELFLDYGDEFEAAWQHHVKTWRPVNDSHAYASAHDFNLRMTRTPLRTQVEQVVDPYPKNLQIRCHSILLEDHWKQQIPSSDTKDFWYLDDKGHRCEILHRFYEKGVDFYNVHLFEQWDGGKTTQHTRFGVPRKAVSFSDKPYTTDMHLPNAFRFPMMIPNDMFPNAWRNAMPNNTTTLIGKKNVVLEPPVPSI